MASPKQASVPSITVLPALPHAVPAPASQQDACASTGSSGGHDFINHALRVHGNAVSLGLAGEHDGVGTPFDKDSCKGAVTGLFDGGVGGGVEIAACAPWEASSTLPPSSMRIIALVR